MQPCAAASNAGGAKPGPYAFRAKEWTEAYAKEIDEVISALKGKGIPVFWVGLPPARNIRASDLGFLNDLYRERAEKAGIGYVDVWDAFVDEDGDFAMRGPDVAGQTRSLRTADGLNFTKPGARKLALFLEREIDRTVLHATAPPPPPVAGTQPQPVKPEEGRSRARSCRSAGNRRRRAARSWARRSRGIRPIPIPSGGRAGTRRGPSGAVPTISPGLARRRA